MKTASRTLFGFPAFRFFIVGSAIFGLVSVPALFSPSSAFAYKELPVAPSESFEAMVDGQAVIQVENDPQLLVIRWSRSTQAARYILNWADEKIFIESSGSLVSLDGGTPFFLANLQMIYELASEAEAETDARGSHHGKALVERIKRLLEKHSLAPNEGI